MQPSHTITSRPATDEERALIKREAKPDLASYGCLTVVFAFGAVLLSLAGGWVATIASTDRVALGQGIGALTGVCVFLIVLITFIRFERRQRQRAAPDMTNMVVQEIEIRDPQVVQITLINDRAPILAFDIGEGKILFLQGQWLINDEALYGAPRLEGDAYEEYVNGLPPPHSFPSSLFTITRLPHSGLVPRIRVGGSYLRPEAEVDALRREYEFGDSELFDGKLDEIAQVLSREHARRFLQAGTSHTA